MSTIQRRFETISAQEYRRRIRAWTMYDWANSAFATTILAAVLPVYFSQVAGATLPSATVATAYWSTGLSVSLLIIAIISPILGTISDIMRGKKRFLALFAGLGILSTAMLVFVGTGDWVLASIFGILGRIGFSGANTFYDALLPHVAKDEDQDSVSARGYAMGYLGGGILLAINVVMIQLLPGTWGPRLSFLSVAVWWAVFTIPLMLHVPEPQAAPATLAPGENVVSASFRRLRETLAHIRRYRELFKYLVAFLIYNDGIGTIIGMAAIYGTELGFGSVELILALLLVQFVGIPYSLIFGRLPRAGDRRRPNYLAFIVFNLIALPTFGVLGARLLPAHISGSQPPPYSAVGDAVGQGVYPASAAQLRFGGDWQTESVAADLLGADQDQALRSAAGPGAYFELPFNGAEVKLTYTAGPDHGLWEALIDGRPVIDPDTLQPLRIDAYSPTPRYGESVALPAGAPGRHTLRLVNSGERNPAASGTRMALLSIEVLPPERQSDLLAIIGMIAAVEAACLLLAWLLGKPLFSGLAARLDTKRSVMLALTVYSVIAVWGFFLDSVIEFWFLAWLVAIVQGGSQALSRSLYAAMSPAAKSGEFFGLFGVMEKFSAIIGPVLFATAAVLFGSSRPAVLSLVVIFILGGFLLARVNVDEGRRIAQEEDAGLPAEEASA